MVKTTPSTDTSGHESEQNPHNIDENPGVVNLEDKAYRASSSFRREFARYINLAREEQGLEELDAFIREVNKHKKGNDTDSGKTCRRYLVAWSREKHVLSLHNMRLMLKAVGRNQSQLRKHLHEITKNSAQRLGADDSTQSNVKLRYRTAASHPGVLEKLNSGHDSDNTTFSSSYPTSPTVVGRESELASIHKVYGNGLNGERQIIFLQGSPGIGKTVCVDEFVNQLSNSPSPVFASATTATLPQPSACAVLLRGQCFESNEGEEPFSPWLDIVEQVSQLSSPFSGSDLIAELAPSWLTQLPWLLQRESARPNPTPWATDRARMIRELIKILETIATHHTVLLIIEDLHWSDRSSVDVIKRFFSRKGPNKLTSICTLRSGVYENGNSATADLVETLRRNEPTRTTCITLQELSIADVRDLLETRYPGLSVQTIELIHSRTGGNPLFLRCLLDHLDSQNFLCKADGIWRLTLPEAKSLERVSLDPVREFVASLYERLSADEKRIVESAGLIGLEFSCALVAIALDCNVENVEDHCESLAKRRIFIQKIDRSDRPGNTDIRDYSFQHELVRDCLQEYIKPTRGRRIHLRIASHLETVYREDVGVVASELARHYEAAKEWRKGFNHARRIGSDSLTVAPSEALRHLNRALRCLKRLPPTRRSSFEELEILMDMAPVVSIVEGYGSNITEDVYLRTEQLIDSLAEHHRKFELLRRRFSIEFLRGNLSQSIRIGERLCDFAQHDYPDNALLLAEACSCLGSALLHQGDFFRADEVFSRAQTIEDLASRKEHAGRHGHDPGVIVVIYRAWIQLAVGNPEQARVMIADSDKFFRELDHPSTTCVGVGLKAIVQHLLDDSAIDATLMECASLADRHSLAHWRAVAEILTISRRFLSHDATEHELGNLRNAILDYEGAGSQLMLPYYLSLLARAEFGTGRITESRTTMQRAHALAVKNNENWCLPALQRTIAITKRSTH